MRDDKLSPSQLAERWRVSEATLSARRKAGKGPAFMQVGGPKTTVRYKLADIEAWEREHPEDCGMAGRRAEGDPS